MTTNTRQESPADRGETTGWVGWITYAGIMMTLIGVLHVFQGFVALFKDEYYAVSSEGLVISVDYTAWGWTHLLGGIIMCAAGAGLLAGQMWARIVGVVVAFISVLINIAFLSAYPIWSTIMIVMDLLVIWAITVHGREIKYTS